MISKQEILESIKDKDDFIKIDYLTRFLEKADNLDMKKFLLLNLAGVNENRGLLQDAIRNVASAADIAITYREKRELYMKECDLWIKRGDFVMSDKTLTKALFYGNSDEKEEMNNQYVELFRARGNHLEASAGKRKSIDAYEHLLQFTKKMPQRPDVKEKLLSLYESAGRVRDYENLRSRE